MSGPQYPGPDPNYPGNNPPPNPDLGKGGPAGPPPGSYQQPGTPPSAGSYPPPQGSYPPPSQGSYPPPPQFGDQSSYGQPQAGAGFGQTAGAGIRLGARIIDAIIVGVVLAIVSTIVVLVVDIFIVSLIVSLILSLAGLAYFVFFETRSGATLGKQLLKLKVQGASGGLPTQEESLKRNSWMLIGFLSSLLSFVPILPFLLSLASLGILIAIGVTINSDPNNQGIHDKFAGGTKVVKTG